MAAEEYPVSIVVVGKSEVIAQIAEENNLSLDAIEVVHADEVIDMEDKPLAIIREKSESSMGVGLRMLQNGEGDAFLSAGNTGALLAGATLLVRRIKGIRRAAIATFLPFPTPVLLMDAGANLNVTPDDIEQFAYMGSFYMEKMHGIRSPRIGLLNNGTEPTKGLPLQIEAYAKLSENTDFNFVGNVEGKDIPFDACDVLVTDGFTGNVILKLSEGMGKMMLKTVKNLFYTNMMTRLSASLLKSEIKNLKHRYDATEHGGAPLLGISRPVIKAHGSSNAKAFKNAIRQAKLCVEKDAIGEIARGVAAIKEEKEEE